jgi:hypothetical protein
MSSKWIQFSKINVNHHRAAGRGGEGALHLYTFSSTYHLHIDRNIQKSYEQKNIEVKSGFSSLAAGYIFKISPPPFAQIGAKDFWIVRSLLCCHVPVSRPDLKDLLISAKEEGAGGAKKEKGKREGRHYREGQEKEKRKESGGGKKGKRKERAERRREREQKRGTKERGKRERERGREGGREGGRGLMQYE